jgi:hypothetical protein
MGGARRAVFLANASARDGSAGIEGSYWTIMGQGIAAALARRGHELAVLNVTRPVDQALLFPMLTGGPMPHAFVLFNFLPRIEAGGTSETGLIGRLPCRVICLCLDHPVHIAATLREQAALIAADPALRVQRWFSVMEPEHIPCVEGFGISRDRIFVMGQGGPLPVPGDGPPPRPLAERRIPFLFAGTIGATPDRNGNGAAQSFVPSDPDDRSALEAAVAEAIDGDRDVLAIVRDRFAPAAGRVRDMCALAALIDKRARQERRRRLLLGLRDLPIHFCGEIDGDFLHRFPRAVHHGRLSLADTIVLMRDTRVVVNDTINLRSSALIRLYYAAGEGCAVAGETNRFIRDAFPPGRAMVALDGRAADNCGLLDAALSDPASLQPVADEGRARTMGAHTWAHRIDGLVAALEA